ncbi:class I SAM-dependent methyltransferase [Janthinobacterium fluminis]|uniref:Class I SAM-dependent methyltransferase n=1 Tax=Janthinobacterium fluminis TaxID=2987524 RepID=A0ABT5JUX6_9BURK|nr:class I SAM-dependent methyltransferase [Janthinobacterium fluminis]MDC8756513.1 class I SAM-dependent methyltransferase [Janthinobacterium fluminis]
MNTSQKAIPPSQAILIFPSCMPRALEYLQKCQRENINVIGSSSLTHDVSRDKYPDWFYLPYITDAAFPDALRQAIATFDIGGIYCPNPVAWDFLNLALGEIAPHVSLVNEAPTDVELSRYHLAQATARSWISGPLFLASELPAKASISHMELASLFRHADQIPGMCDHEKVFALCEVARHSVAGDIVEIGSWWGKSAFVLARLALCYDIGKLLCVDPWTSENLVQNDESGMVDRLSAQMDADGALAIFEMNLLPYNQKHINYLRMPSTDAARRYRDTHCAATNTFGRTEYCGGIAILHIDGNHAYDAVKADVESWAEHVVAGGWVIFDDYVWPYGDGPQRIGDDFLMQQQDRIGTAFVMGTALFVQLARPPRAS